ncbi:MAG: class A beta-lactamase-related serine hydrolase [Chitinophagia bacterium]|nr:class A beta-lactamase-related serine hydrolase [Chitinophagia bacterium]
MGKVTTATLTLRLVEQGRLGLDSVIAPYLPPGADTPGADQVTVRQLLNHTSGYPDLYAEPAVAATFLDLDHAWSEPELLSFVRQPVTTPGAVHSYSNTNYIVLSSIIAQNAGMSFGAFYQQQIATPLGLDHSFVTPRPRDEFAQGVQGAGADELRFFDLTTGVPSALYGELFGDCPVAGNAADGAVFLDGLVHGALLGPDALGEMLSFDPVSGYGLGISGFTVGDDTWIGHSGSWGGFTALSLYNVDRDLTFMTVANQESTDADQPFAALVLMNAVVATSASIPEPSSATGLAALAALTFAGARRGGCGQSRWSSSRP